MQSNTKALAVICAFALAVGVLFWPTLYRYERFGSGDGSVPIRINRVTGRTQMFIGEWVDSETPAKSAAASRDASRMLDSVEISQLSGRGAVDAVGYFRADIYNGTSCTITKLYLSIAPLDARDRVLYSRDFQHVVFIDPLTTDDIILQSGGAGRITSTAWDIDSAQGTCPLGQ